nr:mediator of rna polymerase ii transcription subunit 12 [Quercus suber]
MPISQSRHAPSQPGELRPRCAPERYAATVHAVPHLALPGSASSSADRRKGSGHVLKVVIRDFVSIEHPSCETYRPPSECAASFQILSSIHDKDPEGGAIWVHGDWPRRCEDEVLWCCCAMDNRLLDNSIPRPLPAQRAVTQNGLQHHKTPARTGLPSRLSTVRSVSQPAADAPNSTGETISGPFKNDVSFTSNRDNLAHFPDAIEIQDDTLEPPAKRAKTAGSSSEADEAAAGLPSQQDHEYHAHERYPGSPLPFIPKSSLTKPRIRKSHGQSERAKPARRAHGTEPPAMGIRMPSSQGIADYSPWTGRDHPEDVMNEAVVKNGYFDKAPGSNPPESGSAKQSIWPNLSQKNNTGLQMVAYLFTQVLEKRQALGKCTAPSTFKPPPRVTVTDTRREAWLRDLANPDVPLRKQSRTIPHGVRGKGLMDQCLGKQIPIHRAVWLAKCVGANELRAFRRKGVSGSATTSGESKWVREWTVQIEQFLDAVILTCGQPDWQQRMNYAVKLATSFFVEKLMDADHYLDWVVTSFGEAPVERLPIWLIMVQLYWKDITSYVRRGRKLAECLLDRLRLLGSIASTAGRAIHLQLQKLITTLATTRRGSLIIPSTWEKFRHILASTEASNGINAPTAIMRDVVQRNDRLTGPLTRTAANTRSELLDLCSSLDSIGLEWTVADFTEQALSLIPTIPELITAVLNWASSLHRHGPSRIYLAASIITQLHNSGHDTDAAILEYICRSSKPSAVQSDHVHRVIVDLVRRHAFSTGKYLRWLISSGVLYDGSNSRGATDLLAVLPTDLLPLDLLNTRTTLLRRLDVEELDAMQHPLDTVNLEAVLNGEDEDTTPFETLHDLKIVTKTKIAMDIRQIIRQHGKQSSIGTGSFCTFRSALELVEDLPTLLELIDLAIDSDCAALLSTVADTVNYHAKTFAALGELDGLVDRMTERYLALRSAQAQERPFICGMRTLAIRIPGRAALQKLTANDLTLYDQQTLLAACSPASDNLTSMHASSLGCDDDIDAVFASGNSMDCQLMQRVFSRIVYSATKSPHPQLVVAGKLCSWFSQLRLLDPLGFKQLAQIYLQNFFNGSTGALIATDAIAALVASGCSSLAEVVGAAQAASSLLAVDTAVRLILSEEDVGNRLSVMDRYRYKVMAQTFRDSQHEVMVDLICEVLKGSSSAETNPMSELLVHYFTHNTTARDEFVRRSEQDPKMQPHIERMCLTLLERGSRHPASHDLDFRSIISLADPLSIDICTCVLRGHVMDGGLPSQENEKTIVEVLIKTIDDGNCVWPQLVDSVDERVRKSIHEWAQDQLLVYATGGGFEEDAAIREVIQRYLNVIGITHRTVQDEDDTNVVVSLIEKLKGVEKSLRDIDVSARDGNNLRDAVRSLQLFLNICVLHVYQKVDHENSRQARGDLLLTLCSLHTLPSLRTQRDTLDFLFDLAATLAEGLPEASFSTTARAGLISLSHDPNIMSILSGIFPSSLTTDTWLVLASQPQMAQSSQQQRNAAFPKASVRPSVNSPQQQQQQQQQPPKAWAARPPGTALGEPRTIPFALRRWEIMPDATPIMGENDAGLSLALFAARKV